GAEHDGRRDGKTPHTTRDVFADARTAAAQTPPLLQGDEPARDEEQRHDLHRPGRRREPWLARERHLCQQTAIGADPGAHHECVENDDEQEGYGSDRVDRRITTSGGRRWCYGYADDGHLDSSRWVR